jgi:hypothetical protein
MDVPAVVLLTARQLLPSDIVYVCDQLSIAANLHPYDVLPLVFASPSWDKLEGIKLAADDAPLSASAESVQLTMTDAGVFTEAMWAITTTGESATWFRRTGDRDIVLLAIGYTHSDLVLANRAVTSVIGTMRTAIQPASCRLNTLTPTTHILPPSGGGRTKKVTVISTTLPCANLHALFSNAIGPVRRRPSWPVGGSATLLPSQVATRVAAASATATATATASTTATAAAAAAATAAAAADAMETCPSHIVTDRGDGALVTGVSCIPNFPDPVLTVSCGDGGGAAMPVRVTGVCTAFYVEITVRGPPLPLEAEAVEQMCHIARTTQTRLVKIIMDRRISKMKTWKKSGESPMTMPAPPEVAMPVVIPGFAWTCDGYTEHPKLGLWVVTVFDPAEVNATRNATAAVIETIFPRSSSSSSPVLEPLLAAWAEPFAWLSVVLGDGARTGGTIRVRSHTRFSEGCAGVTRASDRSAEFVHSLWRSFDEACAARGITLRQSSSRDAGTTAAYWDTINHVIFRDSVLRLRVDSFCEGDPLAAATTDRMRVAFVYGAPLDDPEALTVSIVDTDGGRGAAAVAAGSTASRRTTVSRVTVFVHVADTDGSAADGEKDDEDVKWTRTSCGGEYRVRHFRYKRDMYAAAILALDKASPSCVAGYEVMRRFVGPCVEAEKTMGVPSLVPSSTKYIIPTCRLEKWVGKDGQTCRFTSLSVLDVAAPSVDDQGAHGTSRRTPGRAWVFDTVPVEQAVPDAHYATVEDAQWPAVLSSTSRDRGEAILASYGLVAERLLVHSGKLESTLRTARAMGTRLDVRPQGKESVLIANVFLEGMRPLRDGGIPTLVIDETARKAGTVTCVPGNRFARAGMWQKYGAAAQTRGGVGGTRKISDREDVDVSEGSDRRVKRTKAVHDGTGAWVVGSAEDADEADNATAVDAAASAVVDDTAADVVATGSEPPPCGIRGGTIVGLAKGTFVRDAIVFDASAYYPTLITRYNMCPSVCVVGDTSLVGTPGWSSSRVEYTDGRSEIVSFFEGRVGPVVSYARRTLLLREALIRERKDQAAAKLMGSMIYGIFAKSTKWGESGDGYHSSLQTSKFILVAGALTYTGRAEMDALSAAFAESGYSTAAIRTDSLTLVHSERRADVASAPRDDDENGSTVVARRNDLVAACRRVLDGAVASGVVRSTMKLEGVQYFSIAAKTSSATFTLHVAQNGVMRPELKYAMTSGTCEAVRRAAALWTCCVAGIFQARARRGHEKVMPGTLVRVSIGVIHAFFSALQSGTLLPSDLGFHDRGSRETVVSTMGVSGKAPGTLVEIRMFAMAPYAVDVGWYTKSLRGLIGDFVNHTYNLVGGPDPKKNARILTSLLGGASVGKARAGESAFDRLFRDKGTSGIVPVYVGTESLSSRVQGQISRSTAWAREAFDTCNSLESWVGGGGVGDKAHHTCVFTVRGLVRYSMTCDVCNSICRYKPTYNTIDRGMTANLLWTMRIDPSDIDNAEN